MPGYSGTPLIKKLGLKENFRVRFLGAPADFFEALGPLPAGVTAPDSARQPADFILFFAKSKAALAKAFPKLATQIVPDGMIWIGWPKKSSGVATDLSDNVVREIGLATRLVDVKVCAITKVWSGLKFVVRVRDRQR
ncbi:MAG: DUF3052 domain-containing protein [Verrucomicrobia bacterium]|nr:DUF3052 domain-containing protein [Verrucomicrobiota bacterium]